MSSPIHNENEKGAWTYDRFAFLTAFQPQGDSVVPSWRWGAAFAGASFSAVFCVGMLTFSNSEFGAVVRGSTLLAFVAASFFAYPVVAQRRDFRRWITHRQSLVLGGVTHR